MEDWKKIEALLFASGKYLTEEQLIKLSGIPKNKIKKILEILKKKYETADTSLAVFNEIDAWKLNVKEEYTEVIREVVSDAEMPRAVMETLAIIAYKSPVLQSEITDIRGTTCYDHIPILEAKGFLTREKHGRSYKIKLTNKFHEYFDIEDKELSKLFKEAKKPEKLGTLDVYTENEKKDDEEFTEKILERMKKLETTNEDKENEHNFLNEFEEKFEKTKQKIDESEQDITAFRTKTDEDSKSIFGDETEEEKKLRNYDDDVEPDDNFVENINKQIDTLINENKKENAEDSEEEGELNTEISDETEEPKEYQNLEEEQNDLKEKKEYTEDSEDNSEEKTEEEIEYSETSKN